MRLFLIDYENVNSAGLHGIAQAAPDDRVILFYSHAANTLSFEIMDEMVNSGIMPERVCLEHSGKNALDFQLVTFLGYLIAKDKADAYYIISRDAGYQAAIAFCQEYFGVKVQLKPSMKAAIGTLKKQKTAGTAAAAPKPLPKKQKAEKSKTGKPASVSLRKKATVIQVQPVGAQAVTLPQTEPVPVDLETVMSLVHPAVAPETASEILRCLLDSRSKTEFHNALQQHFDNDNVKQYYHCMKPCFITFAE
ncbi:MAG: hypothetical protein IJ060_13110 [Oscillospiraceae bacterium]|nr:hypothetical protein [Oscillospiraceae bacterium]